MSTNGKSEWLIAVVRGMTKSGEALSVQDMIRIYGAPPAGVDVVRSVGNLCGSGFLNADKAGSVTVFTSAGVPYGPQEPAPQWKFVSRGGPIPRVSSVFDLGRGVSA